MIETKAVITFLFNWLGIPATVLGILGNLGTWKADILFVLSAILLLVRIVYYVVDKYQGYQKKKIDLERERYHFDKEKK